MNDREHNIIEIVRKTEIRYFTVLFLSSMLLWYLKSEEMQNMHRNEWDLGCNLLPRKIGEEEIISCFLHVLM